MSCQWDGMKEKRLSTVGWFLLLANLAIFALGALVFWPVWQQTRTLVDDAFDLAVKDAMYAEPDDVVRNLLALDPATPNLVWHQAANDEFWILVAAWTNKVDMDYDAFDSKVCIMDRFVWVTAVPQLKDKCSSFEQRGNDLDLRLRQYLGLRRNDRKDTVVEFWVKKGDLFRPCPDPEVDDHECELGLPDKLGDPVRQEYARWFKNNLVWYFGDTPYPWTRLGYTYDWSDPANKVGASEFVIRKGSVVTVSSSTGTEQYCTPERQPERAPMKPPPPSIPVCGASTANSE
jgi:hypothetical protein